MLHNPVNFRIAAPAPFVSEFSWITDAGQDQAVLDPRGGGFIQGEPGNGANGSRYPQKSVRIAAWHVRKDLCQSSGNGHARQIVVAHRRMAGMAGNQNLVLTGSP